MKKYIIGLITGLIIAGAIGVYATIKVQLSEIGYKDGTVEDALNDLYDKADNMEIAAKKFCELKSGTANTVGQMY